GIFQPGDIMVQLGSTAFFVCMTKELVDEPRLWPGTFIIPGTYSLCAGTNTAGALTKWLRDVAYQDAKAAEEAGGPNAFAVMAEEAASVPAGAEGLVCLPYLAGERTPINDPEARGMFFGLTTNHTRAHLSRAAIEGISCTIAQHFDVLDEDGVELKKVMCAGGGTKNEVWLQCVADMIERPVAVSEVTIGSAYGDALMATLGGGAFSSWAELDEAVKPARVYEPNPNNFATYRTLRDRFKRLYEANKEIMHER
ncbi:MAG: carbohydrate kinase, partial [Olsenella sp.]|nr:carbohydrate kinase [Olsenella sp.]